MSASPPTPRFDHVYAARQLDGRIKVGYTTRSIRDRLASLPRGTELLHALPVPSGYGLVAEQVVHRWLAPFRDQGERYYLPDSIVAALPAFLCAVLIAPSGTCSAGHPMTLENTKGGGHGGDINTPLGCRACALERERTRYITRKEIA